MKKNVRHGRIVYSDSCAIPEKHEFAAARYFSDRGKDVAFIKPSNIVGQHAPDFTMNGKMWELKTPIKYSKSSFESNLRKAMKQSENIIFDLRWLNKKDELIYVAELSKRQKSRKIKSLLVITRSGELLTIKGVFDIMQL